MIVFFLHYTFKSRFFFWSWTTSKQTKPKSFILVGCIIKAIFKRNTWMQKAYMYKLSVFPVSPLLHSYLRQTPVSHLHLVFSTLKPNFTPASHPSSSRYLIPCCFAAPLQPDWQCSLNDLRLLQVWDSATQTFWVGGWLRKPNKPNTLIWYGRRLCGYI